jgi:uncharacterized protein (TIGR03437 family)
LCLFAVASAQDSPANWRKIGNTSLLLGLPSPATGPVERVWFSTEGDSLFVRTFSGKLYQTKDFQSWQTAATPSAPAPDEPATISRPEKDARLRSARPQSATLYAFSRDVWRSEDGGAAWTNLTGTRGATVLGGAPLDMAVSPADEKRIAVANAYGVWFSVDAGSTWFGLNDGLPNLPVRRIFATPSGTRGLRMNLERVPGVGETYEWVPGQAFGWIASREPALEEEAALRRSIPSQPGVTVTASAGAATQRYGGTADGHLWSSRDDGANWTLFAQDRAGAVQAIWIDPAEPRIALAVLRSGGARVLRTLNGGAWWDDITADLREGDVFGVTAERNSGAIYVATSRGVYWTLGNLQAPATATNWRSLSDGLPAGPAYDVRLDVAGYQLYAALDDYGVFATAAPHRTNKPALLHSADYGSRPAAPGDLLSVVGAQVDSASAAGHEAIILSSAGAESQIQLPFSMPAGDLRLSVNGRGYPLSFPLSIRAASPAILIDHEGAPVLLDAETGSQVDALHPAHPGSRLQILVAGLGRVNPDWPAGVPAPLDSPPRVVAPMRALLDGDSVAVMRATLAPGYVGYYLVEIEIPSIVNSGASELALEAAGEFSNRVRIYLSRD